MDVLASGGSEPGRGRAAAIDVLAACAEVGIMLLTVGGKFRARGPKEAMTAELAAAIRAHKPELIALLTPPPPASDPNELRRLEEDAAMLARWEGLNRPVIPLGVNERGRVYARVIDLSVFLGACGPRHEEDRAAVVAWLATQGREGGGR